MRVIIVEDEELVAQRVERFTRQILCGKLKGLSTLPTLQSAFHFIQNHPIDILLLDLNLNGQDGFQLLQETVAHSFSTIIISANTDQAIKAYELGVLDFVPKPFNQERVKQAFDKYEDVYFRTAYPTKYLAVKKSQRLVLVAVQDIVYAQGASNYSEIHLSHGQKELHHKSLAHLIKLLPAHFERIHKSYIVNLDHVESITSSHEILMKNGAVIPISRSKYQEFKNRMF